MVKFVISMSLFLFIFSYSTADCAEYFLFDEILDYNPDYWLPSMAVDSEGMLWLCSEGRVFRFSDSIWEDFTEPSGGANYVSASLDGTLWFASDSHISRFNEAGWVNYTKERGIPEDRIIAISSAINNIVWLALYNDENSNYYLIRLDGEELKTYHDGLLQNYVSRLTATKEGGVWIVYRNLFDATDCHEESCPKGTTFFDGNIFHHYTIENGLPKHMGHDLTNVTWIANSPEGDGVYALCNGYLVSYADDNWSILGENLPNGILAGGYYDGIWLGHLGNFNGKFLRYFENGQWIIFDVNDVDILIHNTYNYLGTSSMAVTRDGYVWLGTNEGIVRINPDSLKSTILTNVDTALPMNFTHEVCCYPNPFNSTTTIKFKLGRQGYVEVNIYSVTGQHVKKVLSENLEAGIHLARWNGTNRSGRVVSSGIYIASIKIRDKISVGSVTFVK